eukprot:GSChrysophyteH2.ASY1.ANO1.564.1 assembled CDS
MTARRLTKNEKRRLKDKEASAKAREDSALAAAAAAAGKDKETAAAAAAAAEAEAEAAAKTKTKKRKSRFTELPPTTALPVVIEYVSADLDTEAASLTASASAGTEGDTASTDTLPISIADADLAAFKEVFSKFARPEDLTADRAARGSKSDIFLNVGAGGSDEGEGSDMETDDHDASTKHLTKRQLRLLRRPTVAQLKKLAARPELVEAHDVTAADPLLLVHLKSVNNSVPVPSHWSHRRKYLSGKRGVEKPPFQLPAFIADTGIDRIRQSLMEAEEGKRAKAKARSQVRPSMGKVDIDYQVLHDAFFKYQTKPELTRHGELYFEGKEIDTANRSKKAGEPLSETLRAALGMSLDAASASTTPPPWLVHQQRYGPPPSYPSLKIPGLSAPLPHGASLSLSLLSLPLFPSLCSS